jgi:hypothetical protein
LLKHFKIFLSATRLKLDVKILSWKLFEFMQALTFVNTIPI